MKLNRVIEILEKHQEWRRDKNVPAKTQMQSPIEIGTAIDYALIELKKLRVADVIKNEVAVCGCKDYIDGGSEHYVICDKCRRKIYCKRTVL